jgi:hypothetical protein
MEPGIPRGAEVPKEALVTVVLGTADEIEMEPEFPGRPKVPREVLATGVPRTATVPKGTPEAGKALGIPGTADMERKPGIGRGIAVELMDRFTGSPKLLDFLTPRRDKVAGFCCSIRERQGKTINIRV